MKKLLAPLLLVLTAASCQAQESHLDQFYRKFDNGGSGTAEGNINLSLLWNVAANSSDTSDSWFKKVTLCRFMTVKREQSAAGEEWSELLQSLKDDHFEELLTFRQGKDNCRILSRDRSDGQKDIVCVASDSNGGGVFFHVRGRFSAADLDKIQWSMERQHS